MCRLIRALTLLAAIASAGCGGDTASGDDAASQGDGAPPGDASVDASTPTASLWWGTGMGASGGRISGGGFTVDIQMGPFKQAPMSGGGLTVQF